MIGVFGAVVPKNRQFADLAVAQIERGALHETHADSFHVHIIPNASNTLIRNYLGRKAWLRTMVVKYARK